MTVWQRLLSLALALFANLGLMMTPFLRAPGRLLRAVVALSLACGLLISFAWLTGVLWEFGLPVFGRIPSVKDGVVVLLIDAFLFVLPIAVETFHVAAIWLNLRFLVRLVRMHVAGSA
jgi:hypothetical protein